MKFTKKNAIHPFEDATSLEFFSQKNDASLMVFGSHSKKRPHNLTLIRMFDHHVLDMIELFLDPTSFRTLTQFKNNKCAVGQKPLLLFAGSVFDENTTSRGPYALLKSFFVDFFGGGPDSYVDVEGLRYMVSIAVGEPSDEEPQPKAHFRVYLIQTRRSGQKLPRVEIEEMGPRMDFRIGRVKEAEESVMKEALKKPRQLEVKIPYSNFRNVEAVYLVLVRYSQRRRRTSRQILWVTSWAEFMLGSRIWANYRLEK